MNRTQAENILDAYVLLHTTGARAASDSLKEVILDAMTSTTYYPITVGNPTPSKPATVPWTTLPWTSTTTSLDGSAQEVDA